MDDEEMEMLSEAERDYYEWVKYYGSEEDIEEAEDYFDREIW